MLSPFNTTFFNILVNLMCFFCSASAGYETNKKHFINHGITPMKFIKTIIKIILENDIKFFGKTWKVSGICFDQTAKHPVAEVNALRLNFNITFFLHCV